MTGLLTLNLDPIAVGGSKLQKIVFLNDFRGRANV